MKQIGCAYESAVSKAARTGQWEVSLQAHAAGCASCREIVQTARWMKSLAQRPRGIAVLPEPGMVWWRFQLAESQAKKVRAQKVMQWVEAFTVVMISVALAGGFAWSWPRFQGQFADAMNGFWPQWWKVTWRAVSVMPDSYSWQVLLLAVLCGVGVSLAYPLLIEE